MSYYAIDKYDSDTLRQQLQALISGASKPGLWYALIDTAFTHDSKVKWSDKEMWPVYVGGKLESLASASPCLHPLTPDNDERLASQLTRLLRRCHGRPMLSFIRSEMAPKAICQAWQNILEVETADGQQFLLRFADTRITPVIVTHFPASAWARLSNGIDEWLCINRDGKLQSLPVAGPHADRTPDQTYIQIDDQTLSRILVSGEADALANLLHEKFPDLLPVDQGALVYRRLATTCDLAARCGMESSSNLLILAVAVSLSEGRLLDDEKFIRWLKERPWQSGSFADAIDQFVE